MRGGPLDQFHGVTVHFPIADHLSKRRSQRPEPRFAAEGRQAEAQFGVVRAQLRTPARPVARRLPPLRWLNTGIVLVRRAQLLEVYSTDVTKTSRITLSYAHQRGTRFTVWASLAYAQPCRAIIFFLAQLDFSLIALGQADTIEREKTPFLARFFLCAANLLRSGGPQSVRAVKDRWRKLRRCPAPQQFRDRYERPRFVQLQQVNRQPNRRRCPPHTRATKPSCVL